MTADLLEVREVAKTFHLRRRRRRGGSVRAVDAVSFSVRAGESVGIAGESGSGKSTLARILLRLDKPTSGQILFDGTDIAGAAGEELMNYRRQVQAVFQNSSSALSPRMRIGDIIAEPLVVQQRDVPDKDVIARVEELMRRVGLPVELRRSYPHELSGGQKQRVAIARSLIVDPRMLVLDEPVSALDVSVRSQVLNLLLDLQKERGLAYLMIAHDLAILRHVTTYLVVIYRGRIVEQGPTEEVLSAPRHPYTRALVAASPRFDRVGVAVEGVADADAGIETQAGCAFAPRCPLVIDRCRVDTPVLEDIGPGGTVIHRAACHLLARPVPTALNEPPKGDL